MLKALDLITSAVTNMPPKSSRKAFRNSIMIKVSLKDRVLNSIVMPATKPIAKLIRLSESRVEEMEIELGRVGIPLTPQEYYAKAIVITALTIPLTGLLMLVGLQSMIPLALLITGMMFHRSINEIREREKKKKEKIEFLLPGFIRAIYYKLNDSSKGNNLVQVDLIQIFEDYLLIANNDIFYYDVSTLIFDMKSSSIESALNEFKKRISIPEVTFLVNALLGIHRGEAQNTALEMLAQNMDVKARENHKKALQKIPGKVFAACWPLVVITVTVMLYMVIADMRLKAMGINVI